VTGGATPGAAAMQRVTAFIADAEWSSLPAEVQEKAHLCLIDDLGALVAGLAAPVSSISAEFAAAQMPGQQATVIATGARASASGAAMANGCAANAIDVDDCGIYTWGHPGALLLPTALAVAEAERRSGSELLTALVVGYEVAFRVARCFHDYHKVYRACASWGSVASAAVAAHLMRLPAMQIWHALGIAEYFSPDVPMMRGVARPSMVKHGIGWGAMTGVAAADLASRGFTGLPSIMEADAYAPWLTDIGHDYLLPRGITWKEYCCCAWAHPALLAVSELLSKHRFVADDVERVVVTTFEEARSLDGKVPDSTEEAQFSVAWPVAVFIADGEVGPEQVIDRIHDPSVRDLAARVEVIESPELTRLYRLAEAGDAEGRSAAVVSIDLRDGRRLVSETSNHVLYPESPWGWNEVEHKFRWLTRGALDTVAADGVLSLVRDLSGEADAGALVALLADTLARTAYASGPGG
jgi:2-methylcitrate dehydratase PrpD